MGCSWLLILGLFQIVAHSLEIQGSGEEPISVIAYVTGVLEEDVYLSCEYLGSGEIQKAEWKRRINSQSKVKRLAGFSNGKAFGREDFSEPDSPTNLTVRMRVSSLEAEGEYICEFEEEEDSLFASVFVTVFAKPDIQIAVNSETMNDTHYQSVSCSAIGGKPMPQISWLVDGRPSSDFPFTVNESKTLHSNGTSTLSSNLRFPTHLQDKESVTCVVKHETLPNPIHTTASVETYARPNVMIKAEMIQQGGNDSWVVSCISSGGRPDTEISLALNGNEEVQQESSANSDMKSLSVRLPVTEYEGHNITCVFKHPKFSHAESRGITLPTFYLSGVQFRSEVGSSSKDLKGTEFLELQEGDSNIVISLEVTGNVPRYSTICKKDEGSLPEGVELVSRNLTIRGPVKKHHAGLYECDCFYHHLKATLQINVTVRAQPPQPVSEKRTLHIPKHKPPRLSVSVVRQQDSPLWLVVCDCKGEGVGINLAWDLPGNARGETSLHTEYEGHITKAKLTYQFPLVLHEGQDLTCVYQSDNGITEKKTVHIPMYYISSVKVLNKTSTLQNRYVDQPVIYRVSVNENQRNQKVLLRVEGNVPEYSLDCRRSDGSIVQLDGTAMVLQADPSGQNKGLYTCSAFFYHHVASVEIQVEVLREEEQFMLAIMICISSASAIFIVFFVILCVCCKRKKTPHKKRESISALTSLMQEPGSPEVRKPLAETGNSKEYDQLTSFSIVFDAKSTV